MWKGFSSCAVEDETIGEKRDGGKKKQKKGTERNNTL
jgi:hypothetical protein